MSNINLSSIPPYPGALVTFNDAMRLAESRESFEINRATLYSRFEEPKTIYFVALRGTNRSLDKNDVLGLPVVLKSALSKTNIYFEKAKASILCTVPAGAEIAFVGHSLGGMIATQLAADSDINAGFRVINLLTIGSPFVKVDGIRCPFRRFAEKADLIPWIGRSFKANLVTNKPVFKSNGYVGKPVKAHTDSYRLSASFANYDCLGELGGGHVIVFDN